MNTHDPSLMTNEELSSFIDGMAETYAKNAINHLDELATSQEDLDKMRPVDPKTLNRRERRDRLKYFTKMLATHRKNKPKFKMDLDDEAAAEQTYRLRNYIMREAILVSKIDGLKRKI